MGQPHVAAAALAALFLLTSCERAASPEASLREALTKQRMGTIRIPAGDMVISEPIRILPGARELEIRGSGGSRIVAGPDFKGSALFLVEKAQSVLFADLVLVGNLSTPSKPIEMAPPENAFRVWYQDNGILADEVEGLRIENVEFTNFATFPVLVSRSSRVRIKDVRIDNSGSLDAKGRNNTTGGILLEEGTADFEVKNSTFRKIRGNALWTHSLLTSPQLLDGAFLENTFELIGRDAIQVGHAKRVNVEGNTGRDIGFPIEIVDVEHGGTPVGIDTAGNVEGAQYVRNKFDEINGKCIDLDGFHDGVVLENTCTNRLTAADYPHGHFGIVMNNSNPKTHSSDIEISGNRIDGAKFGGLFAMGSNNHITNNRFINLNLAHCTDAAPACVYKKDEPKMLSSGIYLGKGVARTEDAHGNVIRNNTVAGYKMESLCVTLGPGVSKSDNTLESNTCQDTAR